MSRSYKKHAVQKDSKEKDNSYNKVFRRVNKQRLHKGKEPILMNELINQWDICDFKFVANKYDSWYKDALRK